MSQPITLTTNQYYALVGGGVLSSVLFIGSIISTATIQGGKDDWSVVKTQSIRAMLMILFGAIALMVSVATYYYTTPANGMYVVLIMSVLALGLSLSALSVATITKT